MTLPPAPHGGPSPSLGERFTMLGELGRGAMGVVYRVQDRLTGEQVALKVLARSDPKRTARFAREAEVVRQLQHPGIVPVRSFDLDADTPWIAFQLILGARPLSDALPELDLLRRLQIVRDTATAVGFAHAQGVVHRDLKAENVLVDSTGRSYLADFGVSSLAGADRLTKTGALIGTPYAMSPEQLQGLEVGPASDVWALGILLYQVLTDRVPYDAESLATLSEEIRKADFPPPSRHASGVDRRLDSICMRCLAPRPEDRYPHGAAVAQALEEFLGGVLASPKARRLHPAWIAAGVVLVGGLAFVAGRLGDSTPEGSTPPTAKPPTEPPIEPPQPEPSPQPTPEPPPSSTEDPVATAEALLQRPNRERLQQAAELLRGAASPEANLLLARLHMFGWLGQDRPLVAKLLEESADSLPEARSLHAWDLHVGYSRAKDPERAVEQYRLAIAAGSHSARRRLALGVVFNGFPGTRADVDAWSRAAKERPDLLDLWFLAQRARLAENPRPEEAARWQAEFDAALTKEPPVELARAAFLLRYVARNRFGKFCSQLLRIAASRGSNTARYQLVATNRSAPWIHDPCKLAYELGHLEAQAEYGRVLALGIGVEPDPAAGLRLTQEAMRRGSVVATRYLGEWYFAGKHGLPIDREESRRLFELAVAKGSFLAKSSLGTLLSLGVGGPADPSRAAALFEPGAQNGYLPSVYGLSVLLREGRGVDKDPVRARRLAKLAAQAGHTDAVVGYASMLLGGEGGPADPTTALELLNAGVKAGNPACMSFLGRSYLEGHGGIDTNPELAVSLLRRAAERSQRSAMLPLGECYRDGVGIAKDLTQARRWFTRAAKAGSSRAQEALQQLPPE